MAWQNENLSEDLSKKIRDYVWSNLNSRRIIANHADMFIGSLIAVFIGMFGGKQQDDSELS